ncbi:MAG: hypothetical protein KGY75_10610 [Candidatus Cloacimonetes bacterium]|nr:hypothetical protein [Candidatus Cloacimonadota bacterium]MBS3768555.1 hypothetical protein [Candidatus Cloacimonadota bacterium]
MRNKISILGSVHQYHYYKSSKQILKKVIKNYDPDIILAELSPEQLKGTMTCNSKPEYPEIIIPLAKQENYKIIPIQPKTSKGFEWGARKDRILAKIHDEKSDKYNCYLKLNEILDEIIHEKEIMTLKDLQSRKSDLMSCISYNYLKALFPSWYEIKEEWNNYCLQNIIEQEKKYNNSKILITIGFSHKFWLIQKLKKYKNIKLINIERYL